MLISDNRKTDKVNISKKRVFDDNMFMLKLIREAAPGFLFISVVTILFPTCAEFVSGTLILRYTLNNINKGKSFGEIAALVLIWMVIYLIMSCIRSFYDEYVFKIKMADVKQKVYCEVYKKAADVELRCFDKPEFYLSFAKAIDESGTRAEQIILTIRDFIYRFGMLLMNFSLVVLIDPVLLLFVIIPLLMSPVREKVNKLLYSQKMEITEENRYKNYIRRTFYQADYAKELRLSGMPILLLQRFKESGERIHTIVKKYGISIATLNYLLMEASEMLTILGATLYTVWHTLETKRIGFGDCLVIVNSIDTMASLLTEATSVTMKFHENALYVENLRRFLDYEPQIEDGPERLPCEGDLVLENVSFRYDGAEKDTIHNVSMRFGEKEKVAIVGHNGAGKTTLVKLLLRLYDASGCITYNGIDIKKFKVQEYRDMFSTVMQDSHVFALSIAENVMLGIFEKEKERKIEEALEKSGLSNKVSTYEKGIDTLMTKEFDENGAQFSGGEQQKLAIAHVYSKQNRYVILDEPSSALDPIAEYEMYDRMMAACADCGVIFISHRLSSAVLADRIYLMENGKVLECGSHNELMIKNGKYAAMFKRQAMNYVEDENEGK